MRRNIAKKGDLISCSLIGDETVWNCGTATRTYYSEGNLYYDANMIDKFNHIPKNNTVALPTFEVRKIKTTDAIVLKSF